jgi:adenylate kinase family enzyme
MQRVLVVGCSGAGKSTLSHRVASITGLPRLELDGLYWRAGWVGTPREEWRAKVAQLCEKPSWILDGNYANSLDIRLPRADTVIWLDYPRSLCLRRVIGRVIKQYGQVRDGLPEACPEHFDWTFLRFIWNFNVMTRPRLVDAFCRFGSHTKLYQLRSDRDAEHMLNALRTHSPSQITASQPPQPSLRSAPPSRG